MRNSLFVLASLGALLVGCGTKTLGTTAAKVAPVPADTPLRTPGCPAQPPDAFHTVTVMFPHNLPTDRLAVKFPNDEGIRVSECPGPQPKQTGPTVTLTPGYPNFLVIRVQHNYGFVQGTQFKPPPGQAFEIFTTKCDGVTPPTSIYKAADPVPLDWTYTHPNGIACAEQPVGAATVSAADVAERNPSLD